MVTLPHLPAPDAPQSPCEGGPACSATNLSRVAGLEKQLAIELKVKQGAENMIDLLTRPFVVPASWRGSGRLREELRSARVIEVQCSTWAPEPHKMETSVSFSDLHSPRRRQEMNRI